MNRTVYTDSRTRRNAPVLWFALLVIVVVAAAFTWQLLRNRSALVGGNEAASDVAELASERAQTVRLGPEMRAADAYSAELDALRRQAMIAGRADAATVYGESLEALAQAGRQVYVENRLPTTANAYTVYLDDLRRSAWTSQSGRDLPADASEFSAWLDQLRRMSE